MISYMVKYSEGLPFPRPFLAQDSFFSKFFLRICRNLFTISMDSGNTLQVQDFLEVDPENGEYVEVANGLQEVSMLDQ